jgi:hypothetical protein
MPHSSRARGVPSPAQFWCSQYLARWHVWWFAGRACAGCVERDPRRRDLFRPFLDALENREAPDTLVDFALPGPWSDNGNLDNLGGGAGWIGKGEYSWGGLLTSARDKRPAPKPPPRPAPPPRRLRPPRRRRPRQSTATTPGTLPHRPARAPPRALRTRCCPPGLGPSAKAVCGRLLCPALASQVVVPAIGVAPTTPRFRTPPAPAPAPRRRRSGERRSVSCRGRGRNTPATTHTVVIAITAVRLPARPPRARPRCRRRLPHPGPARPPQRCPVLARWPRRCWCRPATRACW